MSSWTKWDAQLYLQEFYGGDVAADEVETIAFLSQLAKENPKDKMLDFGCGPTLHHIFPFVPYVKEIHVADLISSNLAEISKFLNGDAAAHNWDRYIEFTLGCEGLKKSSRSAIDVRKADTQIKVTRTFEGDARSHDPLGSELRGEYPIVISCYCADSATDNHEDFALLVRNIGSLVQKGGLFVIACLRNANFYRVNNSRFPSAKVDEVVLKTVLEDNFDSPSVKIEVKSLPDHLEQGYSGIILASATKT